MSHDCKSEQNLITTSSYVIPRAQRFLVYYSLNLRMHKLSKSSRRPRTLTSAFNAASRTAQYRRHSERTLSGRNGTLPSITPAVQPFGLGLRVRTHINVSLTGKYSSPLISSHHPLSCTSPSRQVDHVACLFDHFSYLHVLPFPSIMS